MKTVLFLCTGNYYRSRFTEELFNYHARKRNLSWCAVSAGLRVRETRTENKGSIAKIVLDTLQVLGITPERSSQAPRQVTDAQLREIDLPIAACQREHEPMIKESFPKYLNKVTYWNVEDEEYEEPELALKVLAEYTMELLDHLSLKA